MLSSSSTAMIVTNAVFMFLAGVSVILRLLARRRKVLPLKADDYFIMAALFFSVALAITNIVGVPLGSFGVPFASLTEDQAIAFLKILFVLQFWYIIAVALVKLSVLCFYGRIFSIGRYPISIRIFIFLTIAWLISFLFATFFQVWPLWCNWITCIPTTNYPLMYVLSSATDICLDISILCLPAFYIQKLQMSRSRKVGLAGIFGLGIFCVVSSVARLVYTVDFFEVDIEGDYASNFDTAVVNIIMWSGIEASCSTICANLPCYTPFLNAAHPRSSKSWFSSARTLFRSPGNSYPRGSKGSGKDRLGKGVSTENIISGRSAVETNIEANVMDYRPERDFPMGEVVVRTTLDRDTESV